MKLAPEHQSWDVVKRCLLNLEFVHGQPGSYFSWVLV